MPAAMSSMGVLMGVFMIIFAGCTSGMGLYFLSRCALRIERGHSSFFSVAKRTYPEAAIIFDSAIAIKCFGIAALDTKCHGFITLTSLFRRGRLVFDYYRGFDASSRWEYLSLCKVNAIPSGPTVLDYCVHVHPPSNISMKILRPLG